MKKMIAILALIVVPSFAQQSAPFDKIVDEFFEEAFFRFQPTQGTAAGFHEYDSRLEDWSAAGFKVEAQALKKFRARLELVPVQSAAPSKHALKAQGEQAIDRQMLLAYIDARLLELETIREWQKNPDNYSSFISNSAFLIMARGYAPQTERLKALIAREQQMPSFLARARQNITNPPRVYTEVAIMQLPGIISFFEKDAPLAFKEVGDKKLLAQFGQTNAKVIEALRTYHRWLEADLLPKSKGDYRLGEENFRKKLLYEEMVDVPLELLMKIGMADLRRNQRAYREVAAQIDEKKTPEQVLAEAGKDHPPADKLLDAFRGQLDGLKDFIRSKQLLTIPSDVPPIVQETPPFARALTFASMDTPGPYEKVAKEAYFNVTLPEKGWPPAQAEEHMAGFNWGTIISTSVHEAYPGHYTQFLWVPQAPSKTRKLLGANSNAEGWAHYAEQMMLDEGYGVPAGGSKDSPEFLKLKLGQLQDALLRNARWIVGLQMHTGGMSFEDGVEFFVKEGFQSRSNALRETRRGTSDPTYLYYTLGKLQILKLREDYKRKMGENFSLQEFHDTFLKQGFPPIKLVRQIMLGNDSPAL